MRQVEAKAYLRRIELLDAHLSNKLSDLQQLKSMVTKITATLSPIAVAGSGSKDQLGDAIAKIVDLEKEINRKVSRYVGMKREIGTVLEQVKDPDQVKVLYKRYFEYKTMEQIACEMNQTWRNVCRIHGKGLEEVQAILEGGAKRGKG